MNHSPVAVINEARSFAPDEIFFSTTDGRGVITAGNDVFLRISGYEASEVLGKAHNVVRHPDMPRSAFRLVWGRLKAGQPVAALVKNRAKDGRHYWVVSLFAPSDGGYLSIRFKPTGPFLAVGEQVYAGMLAEEARIRTADGGEDAAMDAGEAYLMQALKTRGYDSYDSFMRVLLCEEMKSRDTILGKEGKSVIPAQPPKSDVSGANSSSAARLNELSITGRRAYDKLNDLFRRIDDFVALHHALEKKSTFVNNLTGELRLAAMNVALASSRLGSEGLGLGVISHYMGRSSGDIAGEVSSLVNGIAEVSTRLRAVIFNLAAARLQLEMGLRFFHELLTKRQSGDGGQNRHVQIKTLHAAFSTTLTRANQALQELGDNTHVLNATSHNLGRQVLALQIAQLGGRVESARLVQFDGFAAIFTTIREQIDSTQQELTGLSEALSRLETLAADTPAIAAEIEDASSKMEQGITSLRTTLDLTPAGEIATAEVSDVGSADRGALVAVN